MTELREMVVMHFEHGGRGHNPRYPGSLEAEKAKKVDSA
jgi:hypothetical protein